MKALQNNYRLLGQVLQERRHLQQLPVLKVVNERSALDPVLRLKLVARLAVVYNHHGLQLPTQQPQILHEHAVRVHAVLSEQAVGDAVVRIHLVQQGVGVLPISESPRNYLLQTRRVDHDFVKHAHALQKLASAGTTIHVHVVHVPLDLHRNDVLAPLRGLERGVDQRFIEVENERLLPRVRFALRTQKRLRSILFRSGRLRAQRLFQRTLIGRTRSSRAATTKQALPKLSVMQRPQANPHLHRGFLLLLLAFFGRRQRRALQRAIGVGGVHGVVQTLGMIEMLKRPRDVGSLRSRKDDGIPLLLHKRCSITKGEKSYLDRYCVASPPPFLDSPCGRVTIERDLVEFVFPGDLAYSLDGGSKDRRLNSSVGRASAS